MQTALNEYFIDGYSIHKPSANELTTEREGWEEWPEDTKVPDVLFNDLQLQETAFEVFESGATSQAEEDTLNHLIEIKERQKVVLNEVLPLGKELKIATATYTTLIEKWNKWLNSSEYQRYAKKNEAWAVYKLKLKTLREKRDALAMHVDELWKSYFTLRNAADTIIQNNMRIWVLYCQLLNLEINRFWATSDPEEIDNQDNLKNEGTAIWNCLRDSHLLEMQDEERNMMKPFDLQPQWYGYIAPVRDLTLAYQYHNGEIDKAEFLRRLTEARKMLTENTEI